MSDTPIRRPWYKSIGPGLITACVVIGPGSIMTASNIGANDGYTRLWVVVLSVVFMLTYMTLGARLGVVATDPPCDLVRKHAGNWLAYLLGFCVFFISAAFQSGNNIGVAAAFEAFIDSKWVVSGLVVLFNAVAISFLFAFKNLYKVVERLMMGFVALMLVSFAVNLISLKPNVADLLKGFVPTAGTINITLLGLIGTTFVITAAFYQAYLVRQKGWSVDDMKQGLIDARVGAVIMALITIMLMSTAAAGLYTGKEVTLSNPVAVAESLQETFGPTSKIIFCLGLFSAAYSSFLVNSMIGGFLAADGFGLGSKPTDLWPRLFTTIVLLTGMTIALAVLAWDFDRTPTIIAAQAVTVVGAPLVACVLFWLTNRRDVMGDYVNGPVLKVLGGIGLALLLAMAGYGALVNLPATVEKYRKSLAEQVESPASAVAPAVPPQDPENEIESE